MRLPARFTGASLFQTKTSTADRNGRFRRGYQPAHGILRASSQSMLRKYTRGWAGCQHAYRSCVFTLLLGVWALWGCEHDACTCLNEAVGVMRLKCTVADAFARHNDAKTVLHPISCTGPNAVAHRAAGRMMASTHDAVRVEVRWTPKKVSASFLAKHSFIWSKSRFVNDVDQRRMRHQTAEYGVALAIGTCSVG